MKVALGLVIAGGVVVGLVWPQAEPASEAVAAAPATSTAPAVTPTADAEAATAGAWGGETRLTPGPGGHFHTQALVNGRPVEFIVDTGASTVALTMADARRIGVRFDPTDFEVVGTGASGPVRGQEVMIDRVSVDGKEVQTIKGVVLEGLEQSLLGQAYLSRITEVRMSGGEMILR